MMGQSEIEQDPEEKGKENAEEEPAEPDQEEVVQA
jgi:hypothetical protein